MPSKSGKQEPRGIKPDESGEMETFILFQIIISIALWCMPLWLLILLAFSNPYHQYGPLLLEDCELQDEKPDVEATRLVGKFMLADTAS